MPIFFVDKLMGPITEKNAYDIIKEPDTSDKPFDLMMMMINSVLRSFLGYHLVIPLLFHLCFFLALINVSCIPSDRPDIVFDNFENGNFDNWDRLGVAFDKPYPLDSIKGKIKNVEGRFFVFS